MEDFRKQMERHQRNYKAEVLGIRENGLWRGRPYAHILPQHLWTLNLWKGIREEAQRYFDENRIAWHQQKHNLLSSQVMCVNLFFLLRQHLDVLTLWLSHHFTGVEKIVNLDFEYTGKNYFHELGGRGRNRTSSDLSITWQDKENEKNMLLLEFKFTEPDFGQCSKQGNPDQRRCLSPNYHHKCYRTEVERPYWKMILSSDGPFKEELLTKESSCPFRYDFYQLMRNQLLAHCIQSDPEEDYHRVDFGVIYHVENDSLTKMSRPFGRESNPLKAWPNILRDRDTFHVFTVQGFLDTVKPVLPDDLLNWRTYVKQRYAL